MFVKASKVQSATQPAAGVFSRLKDPQVWVCAIAAFTLVGLSSGLLGASEQAPQQQQVQLLASAGK
ncbi:hypothetical protein ACFJGW_01755 [Burkholderiaceae bacterium UC74_6]